MNKSIIDKIKKLMSLATSDNEHEAQLASKRAQKLLIEHNISMMEVEKSQKLYEEKDFFEKRQPVESKFIYDILKTFYFVEIVHERRRHEGMKTTFYGREENIEVSMYVKSFLSNAFKSLYKKAAKEFVWKNGRNRNSFYMGVYKGLKDQLAEQAEANSKELMIINKDLSNHVRKMNPRLRQRSTAVRANQESMQAGYEEGKNLKISKGIHQKSDNRTILLGKG